MIVELFHWEVDTDWLEWKCRQSILILKSHIYTHRVPKWLSVFQSCLITHTCDIQEQTLHGMKEQLYEFSQCTLQVLNESTVRHTAHIRWYVTAPVYITATPEHEAFCVLQLAKRNSLVGPEIGVHNNLRTNIIGNIFASFQKLRCYIVWVTDSVSK
jgi:hypothetical protein